jgi:hypothetical protein
MRSEFIDAYTKSLRIYPHRACLPARRDRWGRRILKEISNALVRILEDDPSFHEEK